MNDTLEMKERVLRNELAILIGCEDGRSAAKKAQACINWIRMDESAKTVINGEML